MRMFKNLKVSFFLACKSIKRGNIGTTILTVMIMSLIFVNLIFLPSIVEGIGEAITQVSIDCVYGNILIEPKEDYLYIDNVDGIQKKLNKQPGVVGTSPRYVTGATFSHKNKFKGGSLYSMNPVDELVVTKIHTGLIEGEYLSKIDTDEILLGMDIAGEEDAEDDEANLGGVKVGDKIGVTFSNGVIKEYRLKGIFAISKMNVDGYAFITEKEMESVLGLDNKASQILVKLSQRGTEEEFRIKFMELGISEDIKTWEEKMAGALGSILGTFAIITIISTAISLIMAVVIIFIIIYINTIHKRRQIGVLKAIGIDQKVIINSYVIQALFYCFSGIILGALLLWILTSYLTANPIMSPMGHLKPLIEQQLVIQSIISLVIVSFIAGFIPSWKTVRENILKAIWG
jgi:putative ABC transport system permease protein